MKEEEDSFLRTLETGIRLLDRVMSETKAAGKDIINGVEAFTLFDTYGFPLDLTELICRENGMTVDQEAFNAEMQKQKERARNAAAIETGDWVVLAEGECEFKGWDYTEYECRILRYRQVTQKKQTFYQIVLDKTPFYAEMGGQVGDSGVICSEFETIEIIDTKRENNLPVHIAKQLPAHPEAPFMACVDTERRAASEANHTCTHLLDQALRSVLGEHVEQKGSLVTPDYLRFDFSHFQKVTDEQLREVERLVNAKIRANIPLQDHRDMPIEKAKELGAIALFGEKYGDKVRVVQFADSVEFCGGCHAKATGQIGMVKIMTESSVAAGVRRIEAITGEKVEEWLYKMQDLSTDLKALFNNAPDVKQAIVKAIEENGNLKKQLEENIREKANGIKNEIIAKAQVVNGVTIYRRKLPLMPAEFVKDMAFQLRNLEENTLVVLGSFFEDKPMLTVAASDNMVKEHGINVGKHIREAAKLIQGGGGGQPHFATAGGKNIDGLDAAIDKFIELAEL
jgi:alanyl-tRNA synthetase